MTIELQDTNGITVEVDEGESCNFTATFEDFVGTVALDKDAILTMVLTLYNKCDSTVINGRNAEDAKDTNGHSISTAGVLTGEFDVLDNIIVSSNVAVGQVETHVVRLEWTWSDGNTTRTGREELEFNVKKLATPT